MIEVHCAICAANLDPGADRCTHCGSAEILVGTFTPEGTRVSVPRGEATAGRRELTLKGREEAGRRPYLEHKVKLEWSPTRQQLERVERIFNRSVGTYRETYYDLNTGEVVFEKAGDIADQSLHGPRGRGNCR